MNNLTTPYAQWFAAVLLIVGALSVPCRATSLHDAVTKGNSLFKQEKYDEALQAYIDAQVEHPEDALLKYNIASAHYKMKNYEDALKGYQETAATARDIALEQKALYNAGNTLFRLGRLDEAIAAYTKALELDPNDKDAQQNLEFVREEMKRRINEAQKTSQEQNKQENKTCPNPQQQPGADNQTQQNRQHADSQTRQSPQPSDNQTGEQNASDQEQENGQQQNAQQQQTPGANEPQHNKDASSEGGQAAMSGSQSSLSPEEAEQILNSLQESKENLKQGKENMKGAGRPARPARPAKDW